MSGWNDIERPRLTAEQKQKAEEEAQRIDRLFGRVFGSPDGLEVLALLRAQTIERGADPNLSHSALAYLEGQRQLVRVIETRTANGRDQHPSELRREYPARG